MDKPLKTTGFEQATSDPSIYTASGGEVFLMAVYVDDIILVGKSDKRMKEVKKSDSRQVHNERNGCLKVSLNSVNSPCLVRILLHLVFSNRC